MPVQSNVKSYVPIPDGCMVEVDDLKGGGFSDLGVFNSDVTAVLNYDLNTILSSNGGTLKEVARNMTMEWAGTLINLNPVGVAKMSGDMLTTETTDGTPVTAAEDQTVAAGWTDMKSIALSASDPVTGVDLRFSSAPTIGSVTASVSGVLAEGDDYFIQENANTHSGYSILLNTGGTATVGTTESVVVVFSSITPIAKVTLYGGASTHEFSAYALRMTHTDDNGLKRILNLPNNSPNSGGFQFNFKSSESDGSEEMPLSCKSNLDTTLVSGKQLFSWEYETGAL